MRKILIGILLGLSLGISFSLFAWVNPSQNPPSGGGVLQTSNTGLTINTSTYFISGNVGIGTTAPTTKLEVAGNIRTLGDGTNSLFIANIGGTQKGWFGYAGWMGSIGIYEDGGGAYITLKGGNVGIGTTAPTYKLEVKGTAGFITASINNRLLIQETNEPGFGNLTSIITGQQRGVLIKDRPTLTGGLWLIGGDWNAINSRGAIGVGLAGDMGTMRSLATSSAAIYFWDGNIRFFTNTGTPGNGSTFSPTERMRITDSGNVGIGTTAPLDKLDVRGRRALIHVSGNTYNIDGWGKYVVVGEIARENIWPTFLPAGSIGLEAIWESDSLFVGLRDYGWDRKDAIINWGDNTNDNLRIQFNGDDRILITSAGNVGIGTTNPGGYRLYVNGSLYASSYYCASDIRLKNDIQELNDTLEKIMNLHPISFVWNEKSEKAGKKDIGISGQEIEKYFPELVFKNDDGYISVDYSKLSVVAISAIKEQQKIIEEQAQKIKILEEKIKELESKIEKR